MFAFKRSFRKEQRDLCPLESKRLSLWRCCGSPGDSLDTQTMNRGFPNVLRLSAIGGDYGNKQFGVNFT